jgi:hypothetical protein
LGCIVYIVDGFNWQNEKKMKGLDILQNYLTSSEIKEWERNVNPNVIQLMLNREYDGLNQFIKSSFIWENTPESHSYWGKIAHRTELIKVRCLRKVIL